MNASIVQDESAEDGISCKLPEVAYHRMISHWTNDCTFEGLIHKLCPDEQYIILEADTQEHLGFNVNKFRKIYNCEKSNTEYSLNKVKMNKPKKSRRSVLLLFLICFIDDIQRVLETVI